MATIIGDLLPDCTTGEREVLDRLRRLPDDYIVWPELPIYNYYPDFVIVVPNRGVAILEVKDWVEITDANHSTCMVRTRAGEERREPNPIGGVRSKAFKVAEKLESEPRLLHQRGDHAGKLRLPFAYAVVFPRLPDLFIWQLGHVFDDRRLVISQDRLEQTAPAALLDGLDWRFPADLGQGDLDLIRATLYPEVKIERNGHALGVMDLAQEAAAKEGLYEAAAPLPPEEDPDELPEQSRRLATDMVVRLIRGVVGSGKTLVLVRRARYLAELHPDWRVLVVSFNKALSHNLQGYFDDLDGRVTAATFHQLCHDVLDQQGLWGSGPVDKDDRRGRIARVLQDVELPDHLDDRFLSDEIRWMKEAGVDGEAGYLTEPRTGRGRPLQKADRRQVYAVYRGYEDLLRRFRQFDWEDVPGMAADALEFGDTAARYDAILVDEAQDFAPTWFHTLRRMLRPGGMLFLAADGVQRIYRKHSWKSMGINVAGRTRVLPRSYRNTYEITCAAVELLNSSPALVETLQGEGEDLPRPDLDGDWLRHGDHPTLHMFRDRATEVRWLRKRLGELGREGYRPGDIAIFHRLGSGVADVAGELRQHGWPVRELRTDEPVAADGITIGTMHAAKGLEFRAVFVLQLQRLFDVSPAHARTPEDRRTQTAEALRLLYVAMTRARERVYLTHQGNLPQPLRPFASYLQGVRA